MTQSHPEKNRDIQLLRGVSILLVLFQHLNLVTILLRKYDPALHLSFWLGVEVFFVISGYVIINALGRDRYEPFSFMTKRVFRLTPTLLVFLAVSAFVNWYLRTSELDDWTRRTYTTDWATFRSQEWAVLFGYAMFIPTPTFYNAAMWSLAVEDQFYAGLAVCCLLGAVTLRARAPRVLPVAVFAVAATLYLAALGLRAEASLGGNRYESLPYLPRYLYMQKFDFLALGIALAYLDRWLKEPIRRVVAGRGWMLAAPLLVAPLVVGITASPRVDGPPHVLLVAGLCFGALVLVAANAPILPPGLGWLARPLLYFGDRSYTYYVFHLTAMAAAWYVMLKVDSLRAWLTAETVIQFECLQAAVVFAILAVLVEVVYQGVEKPLTAVGRRLAARVRIIPSVPAPEAAPAVTVGGGESAPAHAAARRAA